MELFAIGFLKVRLLDLVDMALVSVLVYRLLLLLRRNILIMTLLLFLAVYALWRVADFLHMILINTILREFLQIAVVGLVVIFAPELRRALLTFSRSNLVERFRSFLNPSSSPTLNNAELIQAAESLASTRTGALVVILRENDLEHIIETGDRIDAALSKRLLESIFHPKSPLHDGAVVVKGNTIVAARCVLPISDDPDIPPELGLRHRAALGLTELSDAAAIVVSEETGKISVALNGRIKRNLSAEELNQFLNNLHLGETPLI